MPLILSSLAVQDVIIFHSRKFMSVSERERKMESQIRIHKRNDNLKGCHTKNFIITFRELLGGDRKIFDDGAFDMILDIGRCLTLISINLNTFNVL